MAEGFTVGRLHVATLMKRMGIEALGEALTCYGRPEISNTDQGSQFTSHDFTSVLLKNEIAISMDGKGPGGTMSLSSGCGAASNTRRCI